MGRAKGSAGGMTASKVYDKNVLKAKAFEVNNPNTAAQQNQRNFFKEVSDLVNQLTEEQCRFLCPKAPKGMSRRNFLSKQLASFVTTSSGQKVVDLMNVNTLGNAKEVEMMDVSFVSEGETGYFEFDETSDYAVRNSNYYPTFLLTTSKTRQILLINSTKKFSEGVSQEIDISMFPTTQSYNVICFNTKSTTPLTGFGTMIAAERPKK